MVLINLIVIWIIYDPVLEVKSGIGLNGSIWFVFFRLLLIVFTVTYIQRKSLTTWIAPQYRASVCKNISHSTEKKCIDPQLCVTVISLSNIPKVAASIGRKIVAWFAALVMCAYMSIVSHYITRPNLWTVIALKTLNTDIVYDSC